MKYEAVIGLEVHAELKTRTKMFCYSLNDPYEKHPNLNICPICMGHPGTLPVINEEAVKKVIMVGLALNGEIAEFSQFDRKNYFYPDLPKGYQISQYQHPLVQGGYLEIQIPNSKFQIPNKSKIQNPKFQTRHIRIRRIHLEEDTGRLIHSTGESNVKGQMPAPPRAGGSGAGSNASLVDFNRAGVPLMELVTEPDLRSAEEVKEFGEKLRQILRYIGASDANMEKGQLRIEVNISLRPEIPNKSQIQNSNDQNAASRHPERSEGSLGTKVEIKNINSFKYAADAVDYEIKRQAEILERGEKVAQETRGWNENKGVTFSQRSKEEAHDYRYFPEPDLPPLKISRELVEELRAKLPELPDAKKIRFAKEYGLREDIVEILVAEKSLADYFEGVASELSRHDRDTPEKPKRDPLKTAAAFLTGDFLRMFNETDASVSDTRITQENFAELMVYFAEDKISNLAAKVVLEEMFKTGEDPSEIIEKRGLWQMSDAADLENIAAHIIQENPKAVNDYKNGQEASLQFLVGQVMKESRGKANPKMVGEIIKKHLNAGT